MKGDSAAKLRVLFCGRIESSNLYPPCCVRRGFEGYLNQEWFGGWMLSEEVDLQIITDPHPTQVMLATLELQQYRGF